MKSSKRSHRTAVATLALGVGAGVLFYGHRQARVERFDLAAVATASHAANTIHEHDRTTGNITAATLVPDTGGGAAFQPVVVTDDPERIFESTPPSALDYAVLLESLHNLGYRNVNITTRLNWENEPGLLAQGLDLRLGMFDSAVIPLAVTRSPAQGAMPEMLERTLVKPRHILGDASLVPLVNRISLTPQFTGKAKGVLAGFHSIESSPPTPGRTAMLARWGDAGMIPSYELLTIMQAHAIPPAQVRIHCGSHIRLGKTGPVIAIDAYGQASAKNPTSNNQMLTPLRADHIITREKSATTLPHIATVFADGKLVAPTNAIAAGRLDAAMAMAHAFPVPGDSVLYRRLPLWAEVIVLLDLCVVIFWLRGMTRGDQHLGFALAAAFVPVLLYALMGTTQHWMAVSAPFATVLTGWLFPSSGRRGTSSMQEYRTTGPKPVIRA